jgi:hypothetical protein
MMKRGHTRADYLATMEKVKAVRPGISLSSDFIIGAYVHASSSIKYYHSHFAQGDEGGLLIQEFQQKPLLIHR